MLMAPVTGGRPAARSQPIYFDGRFGWLHMPAAPDPTTRVAPIGVVLCAPFAQEEICAHYGLMLLADRLAAAGMPTLRFDYGGTGNSIDDPVTLAALTADAVRAADCLRQEAGVGAIALCGLRLGAAIAIRAAAGIENVAGLALLAPVIAGQAFLRETRAAASVNSLSMLDPVPKLDSDLPLNANGFLWGAAFQREIAALDLSAAAPPAGHALIAGIRSDRRAAALAAAWRGQGVAVADRPFADYDAYVQDPTTSTVPQATFAAVENWLGALPRPDPRDVAMTPVSMRPTLEIDTIEEVPVRFGPDRRLFGILCRPVGPAASVAALMLHEGSSHHIGNGRNYVVLARELAHAGIASLRMDLAGMGDSPAAGDRNPHYDPERIADGVAALDWLAGAGYAKAVAFGLCSGAHTALQVGLADERVAGIVILNLQKFVWHYGDDIRVAVRNNKRSLRAYLRSMRHPGEWRRLLSGKADLIGIARVLARRGVARAAHWIRSLAPPPPGSELAQVRIQMRALAARRVHSLLLFSDDDPGLAEMTMHFGARARRLAQFAPARMTVLARADHHFNSAAARGRYRAMVLDALRAVIAEHGAVGGVASAAPAGADSRETVSS